MNDKNFLDIALQLYSSNKADFTSYLLVSNYYKELAAFINELDKDAQSLNIVGLKDWFAYAKGVESDKKLLIEFVTGKEQ